MTRDGGVGVMAWIIMVGRWYIYVLNACMPVISPCPLSYSAMGNLVEMHIYRTSSLHPFESESSIVATRYLKGM